MTKFEYKIANTDAEFEAIHKLNHQTFVEEIPQHENQDGGKLVDKFHNENIYFICKVGSEVIAMIAGRTIRPFSLDKKVTNLNAHLPDNCDPVEVRLLAVKPAYRKTKVCGILIEKLASHFAACGQNIALISATLRESRLYRRMGFEPFSEVVGTGEAKFQPMYLTFGRYLSLATTLNHIKNNKRKPLNLQPGPVGISNSVKQSFFQDPISHRGQQFKTIYQETQYNLCELTGMAESYVVQGGGTLANELVAGQIKQLNGKGLILVNGEFGTRLANQAHQWRLDFDEIGKSWGECFDLEQIERHFKLHPEIKWLWFVGLETSTGVVNPFRELIDLCNEYKINCCVDAVSLLGSMETNFNGAYLVSGTSSKGIGSYAGLAFVAKDSREFSNKYPLPNYLDLNYYAAHNGIPFTMSSNLLYALHTALYETDWKSKFERIDLASDYLFNQFIEQGFNLVNKTKENRSCVFTLELPRQVNVSEIVAKLNKRGFLLYSGTGYLNQRHCIQVCLYSIGHVNDIHPLPLLLQKELITEKSA